MERAARLYSELAEWWPLLSPSSHYVEEAADLLGVLLDDARDPARTLLELGCGGGSLASNLKGRLELTLCDRSPAMLAQCRALNPECEIVEGDMTTLDLGRAFDRVLVHDAVMYAASERALRATMRTAHRHLRPGGLAVFAPDCVLESFVPSTDSGGEDGPDGRGLRYLEWRWDPDPRDGTYEVAYAFLLRDATGNVRVEGDRHVLGLFARADWLGWLRAEGFDARSRSDPWRSDVFLARRA
jgi:SAM-dependent methyltransferase